MKTMIATILSALVLFSCTEDAQTIEAGSHRESEYLIFGHFYGFCLGEQCIEIFKITPDALLEDTNDFYPNPQEVYDGDFVQLNRSKFNKLKGMHLRIPEELLNETEKVLGTPDAADGGGIYLELPDGRFWLLDMNVDYLPEYLHPLRDEIVKAIDKINE